MHSKLGWFLSLKVFKFFLLTLFITSTKAFAIGSMVYCYGDPEIWNRNANEIFARNPQSAIAAYDLGLSFLCMDEISKGIHYLKKASDRKHIQATYLLAVFYETDASFKPIHQYTKTKLDKAIYYYDLAERQINAAEDYPYGTYQDMYYIEQREHTSTKVFVTLPVLYFTQFQREINQLMKQEHFTNISSAKTVKSLLAMQKFSSKCLSRPFPAKWLSKEQYIRKIQQVQCQAMWDFSEQAIPLEKKRLGLAVQCYKQLRNTCSEHNIITFQIANLFNTMRETVLSVPSY